MENINVLENLTQEDQAELKKDFKENLVQAMRNIENSNSLVARDKVIVRQEYLTFNLFVSILALIIFIMVLYRYY